MHFSSPLVLIAFAFVGSTQAAGPAGDVCWRPAQGRGVGTIPNHCSTGSEENGALCYPLCKENFYGVGPVCWEKCPPGYTDIGALCTIPVDIYFDCPWYDICGLTFAKNCRKPCKPGYHNDGCSCRRPTKTHAKESYGRGWGSLPGCTAPKVEDAGLCYPACPDWMVGEGPVCWGNNTGDATHHIECNLLSFGATKPDCDIFNAYLQKAGIYTWKCIKALIESLISGHPVAPPECISLIQDMWPVLKKLPAC